MTLVKGSRGLGLSVTGGVDSNEQWPGLIRIKRLFPHQPAWESGQLAQGDILLVANNTPLTGLTNYVSITVLKSSAFMPLVCVYVLRAYTLVQLPHKFLFSNQLLNLFFRVTSCYTPIPVTLLSAHDSLIPE